MLQYPVPGTRQPWAHIPKLDCLPPTTHYALYSVRCVVISARAGRAVCIASYAR